MLNIIGFVSFLMLCR